MRPRSLSLSVVLALAVTGLVIAAKDEKPKATKYDSPEAVYKAAAAAAKKNDMKAFAGCLADESLEAMAGGMAIGGGMVVKFADAFDKTGKAKEKMKPITAVLKKHGITDDVVEKAMKNFPKESKDPKEQVKALRGLAKSIKDKAAFLGEYMAAMKKVDEKQGNAPELGKLEDVKKDGDKATANATFKQGGKEQKVKLEFVKEGGSWKMILPMPGPGKGGEAPAPKDK